MRSSPFPLRLAIHSTFAVLWLTGVAVFVLRHFFAVTTDFGAAPHPWQPSLLIVHGAIAVLATFLFGWIVGEHVSATWQCDAGRRSGLWMLLLIPLLIITGFGSFFLVGDRLRSINGIVHEVMGLALLLPAAAHLFARRAQRLIKGRP